MTPSSSRPKPRRWPDSDRHRQARTTAPGGRDEAVLVARRRRRARRARALDPQGPRAVHRTRRAPGVPCDQRMARLALPDPLAADAARQPRRRHRGRPGGGNGASGSRRRRRRRRGGDHEARHRACRAQGDGGRAGDPPATGDESGRCRPPRRRRADGRSELPVGARDPRRFGRVRRRRDDPRRLVVGAGAADRGGDGRPRLRRRAQPARRDRPALAPGSCRVASSRRSSTDSLEVSSRWPRSKQQKDAKDEREGGRWGGAGSEDEAQGVRGRAAEAARRARCDAGVGQGVRDQGLHRVRGTRQRGQGRHDQGHHRARQPPGVSASWPCRARPSGRSRRCTCSATCPICPPAARS